MRYDVEPPYFNSVASVLRLLLLIVSLAGPLQGAGAAETVRIMALGDSLTAGFGLAAADSFPVQLENALKARGMSVEVLNAGVSGDTTAGGLARLDWALGDAPDLVIVALGAVRPTTWTLAIVGIVIALVVATILTITLRRLYPWVPSRQ